MLKQIVNWRTHLKFPEEARLTTDAKDLISKLLCNVDQRLGTKGAEEIKVVMCLLSMLTCPQKIIFAKQYLILRIVAQRICMCNLRSTPGLANYNGINYMKWKLRTCLKSQMSWTRRTLRNLKR